MSIIVFTSLTGSPGTTTSAVAATVNWHRPALLLEADTSKTSSILPGLLRGEVDHSTGLSPLSLLQQRGELTAQSLLDQSVMLAEERYLVPGFNNSIAGLGTTSLWGALGTALAGMEAAGIDVLIDLGRLSPTDPRTPLLQIADSVLVTIRTVLPDVFAADSRIAGLRAILAGAGHESHMSLWLIGGTVETYSSKEIHAVLGVPVIAELPNDPKGAAVYSLGTRSDSARGILGKLGGADRSPFLRSIRSGIANLTQQIQKQQDQLALRPATTAFEGATP